MDIVLYLVVAAASFAVFQRVSKEVGKSSVAGIGFLALAWPLVWFVGALAALVVGLYVFCKIFTDGMGS